MSEILGIHQADVILRSAIMAGIASLRVDPSLLDYAFASLAADSLTSPEYGDSEIGRAKDWFLHTNISVRMETNPNEPKLPCVSIKLLSSAEQDGENTLADVHYVPQEDSDKDWPTLAGPIVASSWVPATGTLTLDPVALGTLVLAPGMIVLAATGGQYPILDVLSGNVVLIQVGAVDQFAGAGVSIKPARPAYITTIESAVFRETYQLTCWVDSEEVHLTYLHSVLTFILLMGRETLLEARGFERASLSSTAFERMNQFEPEQILARSMSVTGTVRQYWPKTTARKVTNTNLTLTATPTDDPIDSNPVDLLFGGSGDS